MSTKNCHVRTHKERVKYVRFLLETETYKSRLISNIDREAFVVFLLLEDLDKLYKKRFEYKLNDKREHDYKILKTYDEIIYFLNSSITIAHSCIITGHYKTVWSNVSEKALIAASESEKHIFDFYKLVKEMCVKFCAEVEEMKKETAAVETFIELEEIITEVKQKI